MKRILFTIPIIAIIVFAGIRSFYNLKGKPSSTKTSYEKQQQDRYELLSDTLYNKSAGRYAAHDHSAKENTRFHSRTGLQHGASDAEIRLWIKVSFSGVFSLAALYVILSKRYEGRNNEVRKWAYSVLTLIAGVWIGTAT